MSSPAALSFTRVPRNKLAETVARQLLQQIRDNSLQAGTRLPSERELMAGLGVGRSTIREAINGLAMLGVLETRHGQGVFVADPAAGTPVPSAIAAALARGVTRDLFEARRLVEVHVARLAAERRTDTDLQDIAKALADHEQALADDEPAVEPSVRFHLEVAKAAHSEVLASFVSSFAAILTERGPVLEAVPGFREWEVAEHRAVFEPIRDGDADTAALRMRSHLDAVVPHHERIGIA